MLRRPGGLGRIGTFLAKDRVAPYVFILPFVVLFITFFVYATVRALYLSFTDYNLFDPPQWVCALVGGPHVFPPFGPV